MHMQLHMKLHVIFHCKLWLIMSWQVRVIIVNIDSSITSWLYNVIDYHITCKLLLQLVQCSAQTNFVMTLAHPLKKIGNIVDLICMRLQQKCLPAQNSPAVRSFLFDCLQLYLGWRNASRCFTATEARWDPLNTTSITSSHQCFEIPSQCSTQWYSEYTICIKKSDSLVGACDAVNGSPPWHSFWSVWWHFPKQTDTQPERHGISVDMSAVISAQNRNRVWERVTLRCTVGLGCPHGSVSSSIFGGKSLKRPLHPTLTQCARRIWFDWQSIRWHREPVAEHLCHDCLYNKFICLFSFIDDQISTVALSTRECRASPNCTVRGKAWESQLSSQR